MPLPLTEKDVIPRRELRLTPAVAIVLAMLGGTLAARWGWPQSLVQYVTLVAAPLLATLAMGLWWLGFSGVSAGNRCAGLGVFLAVVAVAVAVADESLIPWGLCIFVLPLMLALPVAWLVATDRQHSRDCREKEPGSEELSSAELSSEELSGNVRSACFRGVRRSGTFVAAALPLAFAALARVDGVSGKFEITVSPRWSNSAESKYLAALNRDPAQPALPPPSEAPPVALLPGDWPGFRGPQRDGVRRGVAIANEWPERGLPQVWRRRIGPGWSSFAAVDGRLFTQEQRGEEEAVVCLDAETGEEIWAHSYPGRFSEMASSAGPRATPTFDSGRLYALGATGKLTALDAATGRRLWQTDIAADSGAAIPEWGFASSPLVVEGHTVVVYAGDPGAKVIAYDAADGSVRWSALRDGRGYGSPQLMTLCGVEQIVVLDSHGAFGLAPNDGRALWSDPWRLKLGPRIVQPLQIGDDSIVLGTGYGIGTRRIRLSRSGREWTVEEQWHSRALKPYFNDFVYHAGYLYGFDHQILTCIDAETGQRQWKRGRYGFGQLLLIPEQDLLLVSGERGQLALLRATPNKAEAEEIAQFQALHSKTWNHPVIVGDRLYLRNAQAAVCFRLPVP
ncbi:PQQ-binding-like beta-propeller repeat protein [Candidatus Laterigemmans baculatus]|uniref:PQQ-binding-like beta-propeller repeat protein n=1 Tax=Candidatus Laterigemmans baculatus TaxID=2770505 RepID=UPI0013DCA9F9|nr:PQQ-binding-like beta-propeller repeat protein [Candidatus Laterigemmans baculatus]